MKKLQKNLILFAMVLGAASCKDSESLPVIVAQKEILVNGNPAGGNFTLYNFASGSEVLNSDSASNKWDFGIRFEKFIINSYASGPGAASVQIVDGLFDSYSTAPETGYAYDTTASKLAIKGANWYNYDPVTRVFSPKAGKIFIFKTNNNNYVKLEMLSADPTDDNGNLVTPPTRPTKIKYKFRYLLQPNGTRNF
jgi:hypothetical protein